MPTDDTYELLPHEELEYLRREVGQIKKNPLGDTHTSVTLLDSLNRLSENIEQLLKLFQGANTDMMRAYNEKSFKEELRKVRQENAKIAHGIVAVAELVKDVEKKVDHPMPDIDEVIKKAQAAAPQAMPPPPQKDHVELDEHQLTQDLSDQQPANPFDEPGAPKVEPILNEPLPHQELPPPVDEGKEGSIPTDEIPPPPPK